MDGQTLDALRRIGFSIHNYLEEHKRKKAEQEAIKKAFEESLRKAAEQETILKKNIFYGIVFVAFVGFIIFLVKKFMYKSNEKDLPNKEAIDKSNEKTLPGKEVKENKNL